MGESIEGVKVVPLKLLPNERGRLMEVLRCDEPWFAGFGQVYNPNKPDEDRLPKDDKSIPYQW